MRHKASFYIFGAYACSSFNRYNTCIGPGAKNEIARLDIATKKWGIVGNMRSARYNNNVIVKDNAFYVLGGKNQTSQDNSLF